MLNCIKLVSAVFFGSLVFAAVLAPLLFHFVAYLNNSISCDWLRYLAKKPICQYFDRTKLAFVVIICVVFAKKINYLKKYSPIELFSKKPLFLKNFVTGAVLAICFFVINSTYCSFSIKIYSLNEIALAVFTCLLASSLIALIEEFIFRGIVLNVLLMSKFRLFAVLISAFIFAIMHFSSPDISNFVAGKNWFDGFVLAFYSVKCMIFEIKWIYLLNLMALGALLGNIMIATRSIMSTSGFHGGIVFIIMLARKIASINCYEPTIYFGSGKITDSILSFLILSILFAVHFVKNLNIYSE